MSTPVLAVIIVAAGKGSRFRQSAGASFAEVKKPFVPLAGKPLFLHSVERFAAMPEVGEQILVVAPEDRERVAAAYGGELRRWGVTLADGGKERFDSVRGGLAALKGDFPFVAIHDAARPCFTADLARRVLHAAELIGGAIPASRSTATIKRGTDDSSEEFPLIRRTVPRRTLWEAETPQIFRLDLYRQAAERYGSSEVTDDAALFERAGLPVALVGSDHKNPKITTAWDLSIAGMILG
ncbi:MAG: 2-C-methyl-D-erythritol 4-phosphate cytidylyltransferase [Thermoguttaceae bacterium]|nr:2-C-methyl-D-erythritol 4-phosphate cytidylyltransferase [Thermoguttaceae bacterium]